MQETALSIEYASEGLELPADRLLRRIVGWSAILYGAAAIIHAALYVALATKWAASPPFMAWSFRGASDIILLVLQTAIMSTLLFGGLLLLRRSQAGIVVVRTAVACAMALTILGEVTNIHATPTLASDWSTLAGAALMTLGVFDQLSVPALILLLTLPPLARRMV